ncbi:MAG: serpin family protein [Desulfomonile tiedjei]|uniref:Serpin family protein n=1 Tax=Desulfomonile tiedjei TaxID=2358 RepID=A0A9D6V412_9BACT|nr:serpin family protein [Desulfomonile tiedjei]
MTRKKGVSTWMLLLLCIPTLLHVTNSWGIFGARFYLPLFQYAILALSWILLIVLLRKRVMTILRKYGRAHLFRWALKRVSVIVLAVSVLIIGYYVYYLPKMQAGADERAAKDLLKLGQAIERLDTELKDLNCDSWTITEDHLPFFVGPYYGFRGAGNGVRISIKDNELRSCSDYGTEPEGQGTRRIYRRSIAGWKELPTLVGVCEGMSYAGGPTSECFTESIVDPKTCSFRFTPKMDPAAKALCEELLREEQLTQTRKLSTEGLLPFAVKLHKKLSREDENSVYSPYGVYALLGMIHAGAHGKTEELLTRELGFKGSSKDVHATMGSLRLQLGCAVAKEGGRLDINNSVSDPGVGYLKHYLAILKSHYGVQGELRMAPETEGGKNVQNDPCSIGRALDVTRIGLTMINVLRFQNKWDCPFDEGKSRPEPFYNVNGRKTSAPTMFNVSSFPYAESADFQILEMPYRGKELSMIVFLPREISGIKKLDALLDSDNLNFWINSLKSELVDVRIPKFEMSSEWLLNDVLSDLGMAEIFSNQTDLSCMIGAKGLFVMKLSQEVWIRVNEEGTRAVSVTCSQIGGSNGGPSSYVPPPKPKLFKADHPFLFLIWHKPTNSILFGGRLFEPK